MQDKNQKNSFRCLELLQSSYAKCYALVFKSELSRQVHTTYHITSLYKHQKAKTSLRSKIFLPLPSLSAVSHHQRQKHRYTTFIFDASSLYNLLNNDFPDFTDGAPSIAKCYVNKKMVHLLHPMHLKDFQQMHNKPLVYSMLYSFQMRFRTRFVVQKCAHAILYKSIAITSHNSATYKHNGYHP